LKKSIIIVLAFSIAAALFGALYNKRLVKEDLTYIEAIEEVFGRDISGMSVVVGRLPGLKFSEGYILNSASGNRENNFSADNEDGVTLWEAKQLFLNIKELIAVREGLPQVLAPEAKEYYFVQTSQDYYGEETTGIYYLGLFVDSTNYHIYIPKNSDASNELLKSPTVYVEYEPNEITKKLINDIIR
jgi:hypothetical protein